MLKRGKKLISLTIALALVMSLFSAMTVSTYAAAYGLVGKYTSESWTGRANSSALAEINGKMYAYVGRFTAGGTNGGLDVLNVTDPANPVLVTTYTDILLPDSGQTNEKLFVNEDCLYVMNKTNNTLEIYRISQTDGTLSKISSIQNLTTAVTMKAVDNLLFVSAHKVQATDFTTPSVKIYDISDADSPKALTTETIMLPTMTNLGGTITDDSVAEQIATFSIAVNKLGNNSYRIFGVNRAKFATAGNQYFLSIRDITVTGTTYTVETKYEGFVEGVMNNNASIVDIEVVDDNTIAVVDSNNGSADTVNTLNIIDVSVPTAPKFVTGNGTNGQGTDIAVDGNTIVLATKDSRAYVYTYENGALTKIKDFVTGIGMGVNTYNGFLCFATFGSFEMYEYKTGIEITSANVNSVEGVISGKIDGRLAGDSVIVTVNGKNYNATVNPASFTANITDVIESDTANVTVKLIRNGATAATATKTLSVKKLSNKVYSDPTALTEHLAIETGTTSAKGATVDGITIKGNKYLYYYSEGGLISYNITDKDNISTIQTLTDVKAGDFIDQMLIHDRYLLLAYDGAGSVASEVKYYYINDDGTVTASKSISLGTQNKPFTINIVDDYLFVGLGGTSGRRMYVYNIDDLTTVASTENGYGVHGVAIKKISDSEYITYYNSRTDNTDADGNMLNTNGWGFCINKLTIGTDGKGSFSELYHGDPGIAGIQGSIRAVKLIDENTLFIASADGTGGSNIVDVINPANPTVTNVEGRFLTATDLNDDYYVVANQDGEARIINKATGEIAKRYNKTSGGVAIGEMFGVNEFDGMLVVAGSVIRMLDGLYTKLDINTEDIQYQSTVKINGYVEGYQTGDTISMLVNGEEYNATVNADGSFYCTYAPEKPEKVEVIATLARGSENIIADSDTVAIVNEYSDLPEFIIDENMTAISTLRPDGVGDKNTVGEDNRAWSVATAEINGRDYAYLGTYSNLYAIDITTPSTPVIKGTYDIVPMTSEKTRNKHIVVKDGYLYTENYDATANSHSIEVYKINSDGTLPSAPAGSVLVSSGGDSELRTIEIIDDYMFVTVGKTDGMVVYNISDLTNITRVAQETSPNEMVVSVTEKVEDGKYRIYSVVRDTTTFLRISDFVPAAETKMQNRYAAVPENAQGFTEEETQIVKLNNSTIAITSTSTTAANIEFFDVSDPTAPKLAQSYNGNVREQSAVAVSDDNLVVGTPDGNIYLYSYADNKSVKSVTVGIGQVYQVEEYKGMLVMACCGGLAISSIKTEIGIGETVISGKNPALTGEVYGYVEGDVVKAYANNSEATVTMNGNKYSVTLQDAFTAADRAGVQLVLVRGGENIAAKFVNVDYLGEYPYTISNVTNDDGIQITLTENFKADGTAKVYVAAYTGDKLDSVDVIDITSSTLTSDITFNSQTQTLKVFVWNTDLAPVAEQVTPEFVEVAQNF